MLIDGVVILLGKRLLHLKGRLVFALEGGKVNGFGRLDDVAIINTLPVHDDLKRNYKINNC